MRPPTALAPVVGGRNQRHPAGGVVEVLRSDDADAVIEQPEEGTPNLPRPKRAGVDAAAFDEQVRPSLRRTERARLKPEAAVRQRRMKIGDSFSFDDRTLAEEVVADEEPLPLDARAPRSERRDHLAVFARIDDDVTPRTHSMSVSNVVRALSHNSFREAKRK
jgi:hypothetical protein